jgi:hypothetical protein
MKAKATPGKRIMATKPTPRKSEISSLEELADRMSAALERRLKNSLRAERDEVTRKLSDIAKQARATSGKR